MQPDLSSLSSVLTERFRLESFRRGQREVIESVLGGQDTLAVMPTGGGKSLCYQLPSVCREGIVLVISPLIALMEDQVRSLRGLGISSGFLHSGQEMGQKKELFSELRGSKNFVLYLSPERVQKDGFAQWVKRAPISLFAVDESHCVSQWGPDFRKDYYRLSLLRELRPDVPILALTATATPMVLRDISRQLGLRNPTRHVYGFYRPNLYCQVELCGSDGVKLELLRRALLKHPRGRVLIYCGTRKQSEEICATLEPDFQGIGFYHAGLSNEERSLIQKKYETGELRILAATNAFGMGIDHPDVRLVVHFQMTANLESYYQEIGRAGRDGQPSTCLLLYSRRDKGLHSFFIQQSDSDEDTLRRRWKALDTMVNFADGAECRHSGILTYFRDTFRLGSCGHCDVCAPDSDRRVEATYLERDVAGEAAPARRRKKASTKETDHRPLSQEQQVRADVLREWRKEYAASKDVPAFMVFSNKTLEDLARKNPKTTSELERVYGFGPHKVEYLGKEVLSQLERCN